MEAKTTLQGWMIAQPNILNAINFPALSDSVNSLIRDTFFLRFCECPTLHNNPQILFTGLSIACRTLEKQVYDLYKAYTADYNPIENYRRVEETERTGTEESQNNSSYTNRNNTESSDSAEQNTNATTKNHSEGNATATEVNNANNKNLVSAFDTTVLSTHDKQENLSNSESENNTFEDASSSNQSTLTSGSESTYTANNNGTSENNTNSQNSETVKSIISGNIGVTTSQQMLESSVDLFHKFDFYELVTNEIFEKSQCFYYMWD